MVSPVKTSFKLSVITIYNGLYELYDILDW